MEEKTQTTKDNKTKNPKQDSGYISDDEDIPSGCLGILKKMSCTLQCGGTSCTVKETEQHNPSDTSSVTVSSSTQSLSDNTTKKPTRKRRVSKKKSIEPGSTSEAPVKKAKRTPKKAKNVPETCVVQNDQMLQQ